MRRLNKKGAELTIGTLVIIVLAIIVLVVVALGFGLGWGNLWSKMTGYFSTVNVDSVKQACTYACTTQAGFAYCCQLREVVYEKGGEATLMTCNSGKGTLGLSACSEIGTCSKDVCGDKVCVTDNFKTLSNENSEDTCAEDNKVIDTTRNLKEDLKPINTKTEVCCKAPATPTAG